ncbi:hypothetical protein CR513_38750, partial [Mucuna pruriens]
MLNMKKKDMLRGLPILLNNMLNCNACQFGWTEMRSHNYPREKTIEMLHNELEDEPPIRSKRLLSDIYQRCNVAIVNLLVVRKK